MSRTGAGANSSDFFTQVAKGAVAGSSIYRKFGHNDDVSTAFEHVWDAGGTYAGWLTTAAAVRVKAGGNAADDQDGGANARSVTVTGLDESWAMVSETINTEGADVGTASTTTFIRVFRAFVATVGTYGNTNAAAITIETAAAVVMAQISAGKGQTQMALFTVPAGKTGYLLAVSIEHDSARTIDFRMFRREGADDTTAPMPGLRLVSEFDGLGESSFVRNYPSLPSFPAKTDIITQVLADAGGTAAVSVEFDLLLVDDD